jgi:hypothetical protein
MEDGRFSKVPPEQLLIAALKREGKAKDQGLKD